MLEVMVVAAVASALALVRGAAGARPGAGAGSAGQRWSSPAAGLVVVIGLIYLNQVLFTIYVLREHRGDPSFIARHVPDGWFTLSRSGVLESLARHFPAPGLLAPSVLRVNAFLELPFVIFAYLTACRWFSAGVYRWALRLVWPMSVSYTATFCWIEWRLHNQYTSDDIAIRILAAVVVPPVVARLVTTASPARAANLPGLVVFVASAVGLGLVVLVVYDTALLYNLGHLDAQAPIAVVAVLVVAAARRAAPVVPDGSPGRGVDSLARGLGWLLVLAAVPALPIRYGLGFGAERVSAAATLVLVAVAAELGRREAFARRPGQPAWWLLEMTAAATVGACALATSSLVDTGHAEARILVGGAAAALGATSVCACLDRWQDKASPTAKAGPPPC